jgi:hypothetical protein
MYNAILSRVTDSESTHFPFLFAVLASQSAIETPLRDSRSCASGTAHLR